MQEQPAVPSSLDASDNLLLAQLPSELLDRMGGFLEKVELPAGALLATAGQSVRSVYFPVSSVLTLVHTDVDGSTLQVGLVGREGMLGVGAFLNGHHRASSLVLAAGQAYRLSARLLRELFQSEHKLRDVLLVYASILLGQAWQLAICNRHHPPERQLCSLLLLVLDRSPTAELAMTHEFIARMLGVRRETVSQAAMRLQEKGYLRYARGHIRVLDKAGLERLACGCYVRLRTMGTDLVH
jgi:CRP-like cAMP-binding protein